MLKKCERYCREVFKTAVAFVLLLLTANANAQLKADFSVSRHSGCSPLVVSFSSTSQGTSASTTYKWDFDNGSSSTGTTKPSTTYYDERSYIVKLTITDNGKTDVKTDTIIVYKKPVVNFSASPIMGCAPLRVIFKDNSNPGDGTITNYSWDFGDGQTDNGTDSLATHTYSAPQTVKPRLTVTNSYGCFSSNNGEIINIKPGIKVLFDADHKDLCKAPGLVTFTNHSSGPGTLSYEWYYDDGKTESAQNPLPHLFANKGTYNVTLVVKSTEGCIDSTSMPVNIASFKSAFDLPDQLCTTNHLLFTNKSTPTPESSTWVYSDDINNPVSSIDGTHTFIQAGSYNVKVINIFPGNCKDSLVKTIKIGTKPVLNGFLNDKDSVCKAPVTVQFEDTTKSAIKWHWDFGTGNAADVSTNQQTSFTFTKDGIYNVRLTVTNTDGCMADTAKTIKVEKPLIYAYIESSNRKGNLPFGCPGLQIRFKVNTPGIIKNFKWNFGDGSSSSNPNPLHTFNGPDTFYVSLNYTLTSGCSDSIFVDTVITYRKPVADFSSSVQGTICGNTPVHFTDESNIATSWYWNFGDGVTSTQQNPVHAFNKPGEFTIKLVATNGYCESDTAIKVSLIKTQPPFPKIVKATRSCSDRSTIVFTQQSDGATHWTWDFGDQTSPVEYSSDIQTIAHEYKKTGAYIVSLTTTNGVCVSVDTMAVPVNIRQNIQLTPGKLSLCGSGDTLHIMVNNLDTFYYNLGGNQPIIKRLYYSGTWQYSNGNNVDTPRNIYAPSYPQSLTHIKTGKDSIRLILYDNFYGCRDTSAFIPLIVAGPLTGFAVDKPNACYSSGVLFTDTSKAQKVPIKLWVWNYGDSTVDTLYNNHPVRHKYPGIQTYYPTLRAYDANGCYGESTDSFSINIIGPKADFYSNDTLVAPGTSVNFYNTSQAKPGTLWHWTFGDNKSSSSFNTSNVYAASGTYTIKLIANETSSGCMDSMIKPQYIKVKTINASFSYVFDYNGRSCPPVEYSFTNTSLNADSVFWNFGDNSFSANNNNTPNHTYTDPGMYKVVMYAFGKGGVKDSAVSFVEVKGPYASVHENIKTTCLSDNQEVLLTATAKNTTSFVWDFRDGTVFVVPDTFAIHTYKTPGVYSPHVIMQDASGCTNNYALDSIVVDSLSAKILPSTHLLCDSGSVAFNTTFYSFAAQKLNRQLTWHWNFGTGNNKDTSNLASPSFYYHKHGEFIVTLTVKSPYGCVLIVTDTIHVNIKPKAFIAAVNEVCEGSNVLFKDTVLALPGESWMWDFGNGNTSVKNNPDDVLYQSAGDYSIQLIKSSVNGCIDTTAFNLVVHPNPVIGLAPKNVTICHGSAVELTAHDGNIYQWSPAEGLSSSNVAAPLASPDSSTVYHTKVTNGFGCYSNDSAFVTVAQPFKINVSQNTKACLGSTTQLIANGADKYVWTGAGLNNNAIANPLASPSTTTNYMVVGYDNDNCFTDTQYVQVIVLPVPTVHAIGDTVALIGSQVPLSALGSDDIIHWSWSPSTYVSCSNCQSTIATPREPLTYTITAINNVGCSAKDSVSVKLQCTTGIVFIPNSFTPNNDGVNDIFYIRGAGVKMVKHFMIFNRWGELLFEKDNFMVDDKRMGWDGTYKGKALPTGVFVYTAQLVCDNDEVFQMKGTITIIR